MNDEPTWSIPVADSRKLAHASHFHIGHLICIVIFLAIPCWMIIDPLDHSITQITKLLGIGLSALLIWCVFTEIRLSKKKNDLYQSQGIPSIILSPKTITIPVDALVFGYVDKSTEHSSLVLNWQDIVAWDVLDTRDGMASIYNIHTKEPNSYGKKFLCIKRLPRDKEIQLLKYAQTYLSCKITRSDKVITWHILFLIFVLICIIIFSNKTHLQIH